MPANNIRWHDELYAQVMSLKAEGKSARDIAAIVGHGLTRSAIIGKWNRMGHCVKRPPKIYRVVPKRKLGLDSGITQRIGKVPQFKCEPVKPRKVHIDPLHVSFSDLEQHQCKFPYGDGPFTFCGHAKHGDSSYCETHHAVTTTEARPRAPRQNYFIRGMAA